MPIKLQRVNGGRRAFAGTVDDYEWMRVEVSGNGVSSHEIFARFETPSGPVWALEWGTVLPSACLKDIHGILERVRADGGAVLAGRCVTSLRRRLFADLPAFDASAPHRWDIAPVSRLRAANGALAGYVIRVEVDGFPVPWVEVWRLDEHGVWSLDPRIDSISPVRAAFVRHVAFSPELLSWLGRKLDERERAKGGIHLRGGASASRRRRRVPA